MSETQLKVSTALEEATQRLLSTASKMATSQLTREYRQHIIIALGGRLKDGVQQFLLVLNSDTETVEGEEHKVSMITQQASDLRQENMHLYKEVLLIFAAEVTNTRL